MSILHNEPDHNNPAKLDSALGRLRSDAHGHFQEFRSTHARLHNLLARSYLWWRKASDLPEYLESLYQQNQIRQRTTVNQPNFSPLIRLVWGMEQDLNTGDRATISQWNRTLQGLHQHYSENPEDFSHNAVGKLTAYIDGRGGVAGFQNGGQIERGEPQIAAEEPLTASANEDLSQSAIIALQSFPGIGTAMVDEPIRVGGEGMVLLLARRESDGTITVLGSSNEPEEIRKASINAIRRDLTGLPPQFRALVETLSTQAFPSHALPSSPEDRSTWFQNRFSEDTDLWNLCADDCQPKGLKSKTSKRLLVRPLEGDLILSSNMTLTSPMTRCIPNERPFGRDATYLGFSGISRLERWIETGEISVFRGNGEERIESLCGKDFSAYGLSIHDPASGLSRKLHFYEHTPDRDISHTQGEFDRETFAPDWTIQLPTEWFAKVRETWADQWFSGLGKFNQIIRSHNAVLDLKVEAAAISIIFNQQAGVIAPRETFALPVPIGAQGQQYSFFSKDLAPILANLADVPAIGGVLTSGNRHALVFEYETPVGRFEIAIPTLRTDSRERDGMMFQPVDPVFPVELLQ